MPGQEALQMVYRLHLLQQRTMLLQAHLLMDVQIPAM